MASSLSAGAVASKVVSLRIATPALSSQDIPCHASTFSGLPLLSQKAPSSLVRSRITCQGENNAGDARSLSRRYLLGVAAAVVPVLAASPALALLESDEDLELLSKVKESRKKREASQTEAKNNQDESGEAKALEDPSCLWYYAK